MDTMRRGMEWVLSIGGTGIFFSVLVVVAVFVLAVLLKSWPGSRP